MSGAEAALAARRDDVTAMLSWNRIREYKKAWPVLQNAINYIMDLEAKARTTTVPGMTPAQADALLDAVIACRETSRRLMITDNGIEALDAENADDAAFKTVTDLIKEATT